MYEIGMSEYRKRLAGGRCGRCGGKTRGRRTACRKCMKYITDHRRDTVEVRRSQGMCIGCKAGVAKQGRLYCSDCLAAAAARMRMRRMARKSSGLCFHCGSQAVDGKGSCRRHLNLVSHYQRKCQERKRRGIMKCMTCGHYGPPGKRYCSDACMKGRHVR